MDTECIDRCGPGRLGVKFFILVASLSLVEDLEYHLALDVDVQTGKFLGDVQIQFHEYSGPITLDSIDLEITGAWLNDVPTGFHVNRAEGRLELDVPAVGAGEIRLTYAGLARFGILVGPYLSRFGEGQVFTTMLYPTGCRRLLPCWDEPTRKAIFDLTVVTDAKFEVVSNAPVREVESSGPRKRWSFTPTPRMSTYLLYLGIAPFAFCESRSEGLWVRAAMPPGHAESARYSTERAAKFVRGFEAYYDIPYPLPKLDLIAIPEFWAGAMENWGAIAFVEGMLVVDSSTTLSRRRTNLEVLAHEIAHQWFGNLVTMRWWNDFWLNESFATFVAFMMVKRLGFDPGVWDEFYLQRAGPAYQWDALPTTHSIDVEIRRPEEVTQIADEITYGKGASVLRMIEEYLGENGFRAGIKAYLNRYRYANAKGEDLWSCLEETTTQPVRKIMAGWVQKPGHPIVHVERIPKGLRFTQERFLLDGSRSSDGPWPIPLTVEEEGHVHHVVFDRADLELPLRSTTLPRVNPDRTGFFRVRHSDELREEWLRHALEVPAPDRWAFLNDSAAFVLSGKLTPADYATTVERIAGATDLLTVSEVCGGLELLSRVFKSDPSIALTAREYIAKHLARLGWAHQPGEPDDARVLRESLARALARLDLDFARRLAARYADLADVDPSVRGAVIIAFARAGRLGAVGELLHRLRTIESDQLELEVASALGWLSRTEDLRPALDEVLAPKMRPVQGAVILVGASQNPVGRSLAWNWMKDHLREIEKRSTGTPMLGFLLQRTIPWVGLGRGEELRTFFAAEVFPEANREVTKGLGLLNVFEQARARSAPTN
ncbi:MAG: M1 family metallopeptidase [Thermoplasmata archaeon]